jgi:hypothetical protein
MKKTLTFLLLLFPLFSFAESIDYKKEAALLEVPETQLKCYLQEIKRILVNAKYRLSPFFYFPPFIIFHIVEPGCLTKSFIN